MPAPDLVMLLVVVALEITAEISRSMDELVLSATVIVVGLLRFTLPLNEAAAVGLPVASVVMLEVVNKAVPVVI